MPQRTKDKLRGFCIPYQIKTTDIWDAQSSFTEQNPFADFPEPQTNSKMFLGATGETLQDVNIKIETSKAGIPTTAEFTIKDDTPTFTSLKCGEFPIFAINDFFIANAETGTIAYNNFDSITLDDGSILTAVEKEESSVYKIELVKHTRTGTRTATEIITSASSWTNNGRPSLIKLEDSSILMVYALIDDNDVVNLDVYRSTNDGTSFSLASKQALNTPIDGNTTNGYSLQKIRGRALNGQIVLFLSVYSLDSGDTYKNHLIQCCSIDGGGSFIQVTTDTEIDTAAFFEVDCFQYKSNISIVYIAKTEEIHFMTLPHGFFSVHSLRAASKFTEIVSGSAGDYSSGTDNNMSSGTITAHESYDGSIVGYVRDQSDKSLLGFYSNDGFEFFLVSTSASPTTQPSVFHCDTSRMFTQIKSNKYKGGALITCYWDGAQNNDSTGFIFAGGYSSVTYPYRKLNLEALNPKYRMMNTFTYLPIELAGSCSTLTASGTGTESIPAGERYLDVQVTSAQTDKLFTRTQANIYTAYQSITVKGILEVENDGSRNAPAIVYVEVEKNGGHKRKVKCIFETGNIKIEDQSGAVTQTLLNTTFDNTDGIEFILTIFDGKCSFWYNTKEDFRTLKGFVEGFRNQSLSLNPTGSSDQTLLKFGIEGSPSSGTAQSKFYQILASDNRGTGDISNFTENDIFGIKYPSINNLVYGVQGVSFFASGGSTYIGDEWIAKATSHNSVNNIFHDVSPSPRVLWKSNQVTAGTNIPENKIAFLLASDTTDLLNDVVALHLSGINFKDIVIQYFGGGALTDFASFATSDGLEHGFLSTGKTLKQNPSNVIDQNYYYYNELKGYIAMLVAGETTEFFNVVSNSEGGFGNVAGKKASVLLDGEPTLSSGTVHFIPNQITVLMKLDGLDSKSWAIKIPAQKTIHNEFRIGMMLFGAVAITGTQYSKGRRISIEGGTITTTTPDKTMFSKQVAPEQRTVQISWSDGVDQSSFYNNNPDPDWFEASTAGGAEAVSVYEDAPFMMDGIMRELKANETPLVYIPSINTTGATQIINRRHEHLLSRLNSEITIDSITGDELLGDGSGEVFRVSTISLLEIV